jgi:uncharacterized protein (TIGR00251 family)
MNSRIPAAPIHQVAGGTRLRVRVLPRASRTEVAGIQGDWVRIRLAAPPVDGAANDELLRFLAERLAVPRSGVHLVSGSTRRTKVVMISRISLEQVSTRLGLSDPV